MVRNDFYVYALLDPRRPGRFTYGPWSFLFEPFYIGKGSGKRARCFEKGKSHRTNRIIAIRASGHPEPHVIKLSDRLTEDAAFALEVEAIAIIGRRIRLSGPLVNFQRGGGGFSRRNPRPPTPEETRSKISATLTGRKLPETVKNKLRGRPSWNKGIPATPDERQRLREIRALQTSHAGPPKGTVPWNKGKPMPAETYEKCKVAMFKPGHTPSHKGKTLNVSEGTLAALRRHHDNIRGKPMSEETKRKLSASRRGIPSKYKGVPLSPETIAKIKATKAANKKRAA